MAVPGDTASDLVWQSLYAVQNDSGLVSVLIGGNDACASSGGVPEPTPVWNFSQSLNRTFTILRDNLPPSTVITLGNVVNVSQLAVLFSGNLQAEAVWSYACPILNQIWYGNTTAENQLAYMINAYNRVEKQIVKVYNVIPWDIYDFNFTAGDVNTLDYFHPDPVGQSLLAQMWWAQLPYAKMLPRMSNATYPASLPQGTDLNLSVSSMDVVPMDVTATYLGPGMHHWATVNLSFQAGVYYNGTFNVTLPANATANPGTLKIFLSANDTTGYSSTLPCNVPIAMLAVRVTTTTAPTISSFTASPNPVVAGETTYLNVTAYQGNPPYDYAYSGLPPGCQSANTSSLSCTPQFAGNFTVRVYVNDSVGLSALPNDTPLVVDRAVTLTTVTLSPSSTTLSPGGSQVFVTRLGCTGGACPSGATYSWTLTSSLGSLGSMIGSSATVTAGSTGGGNVAVFANATLGGVTVMSAPATIVVTSQSTPLLTGVTVDPASAKVQTGNSVFFNATPVCAPGSCVGTVTCAWAVTGALGSLSSNVGSSTRFLAFSNAGNVTLIVSESLNGIEKNASVPIEIMTSVVPTLRSVTISPLNVNLPVETPQEFTSFVVCSPSPCLTGATYTWEIDSLLGNLTTTTGDQTTLVAGSTPGQVDLTVVASLNGKQVQNVSTIMISEPSSGPAGISSMDVVLAAMIAVAAVVAVVALSVIMRRNRKASGPPPQLPMPPWPGYPPQ
jgi:lysophospholipase L1-like esterase